jgi:hypothetical protein
MDFEKIVGIDPDNPEYETVATESTKQQLLDEVYEMIEEPQEHTLWRARMYRRPDEENERIIIKRCNSHPMRRNQGSVAAIIIEELPEDGRLEGINTTYRFFKSPDGIQITKSSRPLVLNTPENIERALWSRMAQHKNFAEALIARGESRKMENALGLNILYEFEALELLFKLNEVQPI